MLFFSNYVSYVKFNTVAFGGLNVHDHLLTGIGCEKEITHNEM